MSQYIILTIIALIIGAILKPAGEYLLAIIIFKIGEVPHRKIGVKWKSRWSFNDPDKNESHEDIVTLHQFGPFVRGSGTGDGYNYKINARLKPDGCIHGTWRKIQKGSDWYGSLMLNLSGGGKSARGKWIGKSTSAGVRAGDWEWWYLSD
jgi:hypothetical protein